MLITSPAMMEEFGKQSFGTHKKILLNGELWAWKTLFTKWYATALWIDKNIVQSPTYTYLNIYNKKLLHIDMYRFEKFEDLLEKGILEEMENYDYIIIERPKFLDKIDYSEYHVWNIEKISDGEREIHPGSFVS